MSSVTTASSVRQAAIPMTDESKALATTRTGELIAGGDPIVAPDVFQQRIESLRHSYHVIAPPVQVLGGFFPGYAIVAAQVQIDTSTNEDGQGPETYFDKGFMKGDQRALNKVGLLKVCTAAGVKWIPEQTGRRDVGTEPYLWQYQAVGIVDTADGQYQILSGEVEIDLRDGSPQIGGWTPELWAALMAANQGKPKGDQRWAINGWSEARVRQARSRGLALAETKSKNRAIRSLGLQQVYTARELQKPFLIFRAVYQPDMSDPVIRQMVAERALHGRKTLYPGSEPVVARQLSAPNIPPAGTIDTTAATQAEDAGPTAAPLVRDIPAPQIRVVGVAQVIHEGLKVDLWDVSFSDGRVARTRDASIHDVAVKVQASQQGVEPTLVKSDKRPGSLNLIELVVLPLPAGVPSADDLY